MAPDIAPGQELKSIPDSLLEAICRTDNLLERICLDWWEMDHNQLESLLKAFPYLRHLQVAVSASMAKIVAMNNAFANVGKLETLRITSRPIFNTAAPKVQKRSEDNDPRLRDLPEDLAEKISVLDPTLPELRDLRKFVRRLHFITEIQWTGRGGKGNWRFFNDTKKKSSLIGVDFTHAAISTFEIYKSCLNPPKLPAMDDSDLQYEEVLEMPIPLHTPAMSEFPTLTRSTTGNSSQWSIVTPKSIIASPISDPLRSDKSNRRSSLPTVSKSFPGSNSGIGIPINKSDPSPGTVQKNPTSAKSLAATVASKSSPILPVVISKTSLKPQTQKSDSSWTRQDLVPMLDKLRERKEDRMPSKTSLPQPVPTTKHHKRNASSRPPAESFVNQPVIISTNALLSRPVQRIVPGAGHLQKLPPNHTGDTVGSTFQAKDAKIVSAKNNELRGTKAKAGEGWTKVGGSKGPAVKGGVPLKKNSEGAGRVEAGNKPRQRKDNKKGK